LFIFLSAETFYQIYKRKEDPFKIPEKIIRIEEFEERVAGGEQLVLLDDLVLDVTQYQWNHPGGRFVIQ
jgi:cytochrome b involved in lipid metabolism